MDPVDPNTQTQASNEPASTAKTVQLATSEKHPLTGQVLGTYEIADVLGKGGMGVVFRAKDPALDRMVALKVLAPELSGDSVYVERFLREAKAAAKLDHPNVVQVHAAGQTQSFCWMAMQFAKGVPLSGHLRKGRKFTVTESLQVVRQVALALGAAHKAGIIHRDIKPSNIMLDETGRALVMDFGLSRGIMSGERITRTGTYLGTPEYSSPEQCETNDLDGRSDLYSLGVVFYELLTGRVPHVAETPLALFKKIAEERPTPVTLINKQVPTSVQALLDRMIAKDRERRYATAEDIVRDIDKVLEGQSLPAVKAPPSPMRLRLAAAVATILLAAGVAVWKWPSTTEPQPVTPVNGGGDSAAVEPETLGTAVVVLDFKDLKGDPETAWMEVGIPELLLGQLDGLLQGNIVPREELLETMAQVVGKKVKAEQGDARLALGKELAKVVARVGGRLVVTGTYLVDGDQIRVTANVYERKAGAELVRIETCTVNGTTSDLFTVVDRLAESVASRALTAMAPQPGRPTAPASSAAAPANYGMNDAVPETSSAPSEDGGRGQGEENASKKLKESILQIVGKAGDKLALERGSQNLNNMILGMRRGFKQAGKGGAPEPPAPPGTRKDEDVKEGEKAPGGDQGGAPDLHGELAATAAEMEKLKRFFQNLRTVEDMDLSQQKALRNDQAFLESLCEEGCADTLTQKFESWRESNQAPRQEAQPAK